jgi:hypothetical protein
LEDGWDGEIWGGMIMGREIMETEIMGLLDMASVAFWMGFVWDRVTA